MDGWNRCSACRGTGFVAYNAKHDLDVECLACVDRELAEADAHAPKSVASTRPPRKAFARSPKRAEGEQ